MQELDMKIIKEHGDTEEVLHEGVMIVDAALDLAEAAVQSLDPDDYYTIIHVIPPMGCVFSFSRTETTILVCLDGKPHAESPLV